MENIQTASAGFYIQKTLPKRKHFFKIFLILYILSLFGSTFIMLSEKWKLLGKWIKFNASPSNKMHRSTLSPLWTGMMIESSSQICHMDLKTRVFLVVACRISISFRFIVQLRKSNSFCVLPHWGWHREVIAFKLQ